MEIVFWGKVQHGDKRGKQLGFPTANLFLHKDIEEGVYVSVVRSSSFNVHSKNTWIPSLTFIGSAKTFNKKEYKAEAHILDFNKDIYGKVLTVRLLKKLRGNKKYNNVTDLVCQMKEDEQAARAYFKKLQK